MTRTVASFNHNPSVEQIRKSLARVAAAKAARTTTGPDGRSYEVWSSIPGGSGTRWLFGFNGFDFYETRTGIAAKAR